MRGDSFEADIMGALSVGMQAIHYVNFGEKKHDKCLIINELNVLKGLKKTINQNNCILQIEIFKENFEIINKFLLENKFNKINTEIYHSNYFYSKKLL